MLDLSVVVSDAECSNDSDDVEERVAASDSDNKSDSDDASSAMGRARIGDRRS